MFDKFKKYLELEFSEDFWSDEGMSHAVSLISQFTELDWLAFLESIANQSEIWMIRCSEALGDVGYAQSLEALLKLISLGSKSVVIAALDSINSLATRGFDISPYKHEIQNTLNKIITSDHVTRAMISSLQIKIK